MQWLVSRTTDQGVPGSRPGQEAEDVRLTWIDCDEAGYFVVPNVLSPRDLFFRPDNMDQTVLHKQGQPSEQLFP